MDNAKTIRGRALLDFVKMIMDNSKVQDNAHDLEHVLRVWKIGIQIGEAENKSEEARNVSDPAKLKKADFEILEPALLLHDIIRPASFFDNGKNHVGRKLFSKKQKDHGIESAVLSKKILRDFNYTDEEIKKITHAIEAHTSTSKRTAPKTIEAKIVYDSDIYDTLGFSGCARAALFSAKENMNTGKMAEEYLLKIKKMLSGAPFYTQSAVNIGDARLTVSLDFCREILGNERFEKVMNR